MTCSGFFDGGIAIKIKEMKIGELDEFLENEEPFSDFFVLVQDDEHRELLEGNYLFVPELGIDTYRNMGKLERRTSGI